jgi:1,4-dihydroxy-6-naphthoate synthase
MHNPSNRMTLQFGFSPCPNDTFMFEPIVSRRIDTLDLDFRIHLADVETLNIAALEGKPDVTKLSFNAFTKVKDTYQMLQSGAALGNQCGPLLISKSKHAPATLRGCRIAIPGKHTTAFLLLKYAFPASDIHIEYVFSDIEQAVLQGDVDAGVIIHENRFTYAQKGLFCWQDLGEYWEKKTGAPIPLGGIAVRRSLPDNVKRTIGKIIHQSVEYAFAHPQSGMDYIRSHAQEMDTEVMQEHINLYVNHYSRQLGEKGRKAVQVLFQSVFPNITQAELTDLFVPSE